MSKDIISASQFHPGNIKMMFREADAMAEMVETQGRSDLLDDLVVANLFYEPSTRTFLSFEAAAKRLGAATIATQGVEYSSIAKGETLEDTIRTVERYADTISIRHGQVGAAAVAAEVAKIPIINGGDGVGEHPTQALLDLYTIQHELGTTEDLTVTMVGDLKNGRTVHSLARLLALYDNRLNYVAPGALRMPAGITDELARSNVEQYATEDIMDVVEESDVIYVTRVQKERFKPPTGPFKNLRASRSYTKVKDAHIITPQVMSRAPHDAILMHPLPRNHEIVTELDYDKRAVYFDQVEAGMYIRMALLAYVNDQSITSYNNDHSHPRWRNIEPWLKTNGKAS
jgi:aspartate carbamoyltransferase